ncbi:MAG: DapH/DapD/GlmU-related protein [Candidatus Fimadaptatus sp.]
MKQTASSGNMINRTWGRLKPLIRLLIYRNWWTMRKNRIALGERVRIVGTIIVMNDKTHPGSMSIGDGTTLNSHYQKANPLGYNTPCVFRMNNGGSISIGKRVGIYNSVFVSYGEPISIGDYTLIGGGCKFYTTDFHPLSPALRRQGDLEHAKTGRIVIGENAFIGAGTTVLKGVSIGNNAVIGACSVVTRDIPANEIWGGNPARFIKRIEEQ